MKDRWMNIGWEDKELKPYKDQSRKIEPEKIGNLLDLVEVVNSELSALGNIRYFCYMLRCLCAELVND